MGAGGLFGDGGTGEPPLVVLGQGSYRRIIPAPRGRRGKAKIWWNAFTYLNTARRRAGMPGMPFEDAQQRTAADLFEAAHQLNEYAREREEREDAA